MKVGKEVKRVKSPERRTQKVKERPDLIPVQIPQKEPAKVGQESAGVDWQYLPHAIWGLPVRYAEKPIVYLTIS